MTYYRPVEGKCCMNLNVASVENQASNNVKHLVCTYNPTLLDPFNPQTRPELTALFHKCWASMPGTQSMPRKLAVNEDFFSAKSCDQHFKGQIKQVILMFWLEIRCSESISYDHEGDLLSWLSSDSPFVDMQL